MPTGHYLTREQIDYIRSHFADTPNKEIASALGIAVSTVNRIQSVYRLMKTPAHLKEMHRLSGLASVKQGKAIILTPEIIRKRAESYKQTHKLERARVHFGLEQKTKIKVQRRPRQMIRQRYYLHRRGYIIDNDNLIAYYTDQTKRATRMEAYKNSNKYKIYYNFMQFNK